MTTDHHTEFMAYLNDEKHLALMLRKRVALYGGKPALKDRANGEWEETTWAEFGEMVDATAKALLELGVEENERVGIFSQNRALWTIADVGILSTRAVSVPVYATNSADEAEYIVGDAGIRILFVNDQVQYDKAVEVLNGEVGLEHIIVFDSAVTLNPGSHSMFFSDFLDSGRKSNLSGQLEQRLSQAGSEDLYTLIYTSGTTGPPKGAMLSHKNALAALYGTGYSMPLCETDVSFCFLPLSHVFERSWTYFVLSRGAENHYCHDTAELKEFLSEVRPHYMVSVPRVWEKIHGTIMEGVKNASGKKQALFFWALGIGKKYNRLKNSGKKSPMSLSLAHGIADKLVLSKIKNAVGGRNKFYHAGGAPLNPAINEFFVNAGVRLGVGYGLTEIFPICVCTLGDIGFGTSGKPIPLVDIRISGDGEIQAKSPGLMKGYWNKPEADAETTTRDGWIKTGDIGEITPEGYVKITDRIKEIIITAGGKNISPQTIETCVKEDIYIEQAVAVGDGKPYITALIVPSFSVLAPYATEKGIAFASFEELVKHPDIIKFYKRRIDKRTRSLGQVEKIKTFTLLSAELSQEAGELTPTSKLKRRVIHSRYSDVIESMYGSSS